MNVHRSPAGGGSAIADDVRDEMRVGERAMAESDRLSGSPCLRIHSEMKAHPIANVERYAEMTK